jgi:uncharacterized protein (DUF1697 family)
MSDLRRLCQSAGFQAIRTYIASGNVVFESEGSEGEVKAALEAKLRAHAGKPMGVLVRTAAQMAEVLANNPFPNAAPNRTVAVFLNEPPAPDTLETVVGLQGEELRLGAREVFVHYGEGMAHSKLHIPAARDGTARNMNTVSKLASMAAEHT